MAPCLVIYSFSSISLITFNSSLEKMLLLSLHLGLLAVASAAAQKNTPINKAFIIKLASEASSGASL